MVQLIGAQGEYNGTNMAESISLEFLQKCTNRLLIAFIKVRLLNNLTTTCNMSSKKGTPAEVRADVIFQRDH